MEYLLLLIALVAMIWLGISWARQRKEPLLTAPAKIIAKRLAVTSWPSSYARTEYFLTFQLTNGSRFEFSVDEAVYGLSAEGDVGLLSTKGTRLQSFDRGLPESLREVFSE